MRTKTLFIGLLAATTAVSACHKSSSSSTNTTDQNFMKNASYSNMDEVSAGQTASTKAMDDTAVMNFGMMMVADHTTSEADLKTLANQKGVSIPDTADATHKAMVMQMMNMSGRTFDSTYMHAQVTDHTNTVALFQDEITNGKDADVKAYANKYLPKIQMHLMKADTVVTRY